MTLLRGDRSEAEANAVKKLLAGKESVTLTQLEEYALCQSVHVSCNVCGV